MLRQKPRAGLHDLDAPESVGLDDDTRADRVTIACRCQPAEWRALRRAAEIVAEDREAAAPGAPPSPPDPDRRRDRRRARRTIGHPDPDRVPSARNVVKPATPIVAQEHVSLPAGNRLAHEQLIHRAPRVVVRRAADARRGRARHDLTPEEALQISWTRCRASTCRWRRRGLPSRRCRSRARRTTTPSGPCQPARRASCPRTGRCRGSGRASCLVVWRRYNARTSGEASGMNAGDVRHTQAARAPDVAGVDVEVAIVVVVEESRAHSGAVIEHARGCGHVFERHLSVAPAAVSVEILRARSRSRPADRSTRPRRSRPTRPRSDSGRSPRPGPPRWWRRRSARARRCGRGHRAARCARRSMALAFRALSSPAPKKYE